MLVCVALTGQNVLLPWKPGPLARADLPRPVGPNHSGLTPQTGLTPSRVRHSKSRTSFVDEPAKVANTLLSRSERRLEKAARC